MARINEIEFKNQIKQGNYNNLYFIYGEEKVDVSKFTKSLVSKVIDKGMEIFNLHSFDFAKLDYEQLADAAMAIPVMSKYHCVKIRDFDVEAVNSNDYSILENIIEQLPRSTILIIYLPNISIEINKSTKWKKFIKLIEEKGIILECTKHTRSYMSKKLIDYCQRKNCVLSKQLALYIIEICGEDSAILQNEIQKLVFYVGTGEITKKHIDDIITKSMETTVFELTNALSLGKYENAFKLFQQLMYQKEEPMAVFGVIAGSYVNMYRAKAAVQSGVMPENSAKSFGYNKPTVMSIAAKNSRNLSMEQLRKSIDILNQTDLKMKSSKTDNRILLEEMLTKLVLIRQ